MKFYVRNFSDICCLFIYYSIIIVAEQLSVDKTTCSNNFYRSHLMNDVEFACLWSLQHTSFPFQNRPRWCLSTYSKLTRTGNLVKVADMVPGICSHKLHHNVLVSACCAVYLNTNCVPKYLAELCVPVADVAGRRQLRSASRRLWNFPRYNVSNYGRRALCFAGPYVWNSLPEHIRQSISIAVFKRSLKTFLLQQILHLAR